MPLTVPNIIRSYARGGGSIVFALDIEPSAVDSWTTKRFATASIEVAGDAYDDATLGGLAKIGFEAKVIQGGNVATLPDVDVKLLNKAKLHEEFVTDIIEGRRATVRMTAVGPNMCLNSSFEKRTGADFESWTEVPGAGGSIAAETGTVYDGAAACKLTGGTVGSYVVSAPLVWRVGSKVVVSCYARTPSGTATLKAAVHATSSLWYNATSKTFGLSRVKNTLGTANTSWQRFSLEMDWKDFYAAQAGVGTALLIDQPFYVELWSEPSEAVIVDAVQIELNNQLTPYNHNRYELVAADVVTVFSGIVKNPAWSADEISISLESWNSNKHRDIPKTILTDATDATWKVPKDSMGKPFPMTYGDFMSEAETVWDQARSGTLKGFARGLLTNADPNVTGGIVVYFDRPGIALYHPAASADVVYRLYHLCEDDGKFYEQACYDKGGYSYDDVEFIDDLAANSRWKQSASPAFLKFNKFFLMAALRAKQILWYEAITDPENMVDGNLATKAIAYEPGYPRRGEAIVEVFPFDPEDIITESGLAFPGAVFILADLEFGLINTGTVTVSFYLSTNNNWAVDSNPIVVMNAVGPLNSWKNIPAKRIGAAMPNKALTQAQHDYSGSGSGSTWNDFATKGQPDITIYWNFDCTNMGAGLGLNIYELGVLYYFTVAAEDARYASQQFGRTFGTTWNGRKTGASMVESAPEIIESILREELGAANADINETLFDASDTARAIAAAGQLHEVKNSMDVIKDICDEYGLLYYVDILGKHSLVNLDWRPVTKHLFLHDWYKPFDKVKISYTPRSEIVNDIILHYDRNQFTGEYRKVAFCNKDAASGAIGTAYIAKCAASYAELGNAVQATEINADWIKDTATAEAMVKWTIDWLYKQRIIITGDLFLDNLDLTFGDIADVDLEPLLPKSFTSIARFMAISASISRTNSRISVKLLEVKEP